MTTTQRRIALLTGASLVTLGAAAPAYAATNTFPTGVHHTGLTGGVVNDTITISLPGDTDNYGVTTPSGSSGGTVTTTLNFPGPLVQQTGAFASTFNLNVTNGGT